MKLIFRLASSVAAFIVAGLGLAISYDGFYLYFEEAKNPYYSPPWWKSVVIFILLGLCLVVPLITAYKLIRFSITGRFTRGHTTNGAQSGDPGVQ